MPYVYTIINDTEYPLNTADDFTSTGEAMERAELARVTCFKRASKDVDPSTGEQIPGSFYRKMTIAEIEKLTLHKKAWPVPGFMNLVVDVYFDEPRGVAYQIDRERKRFRRASWNLGEWRDDWEADNE